MKTTLLFLGLLLCYSVSFSQTTGTFKDERDGKIYKTVNIGSQTMMAENFAFKPSNGNYWAYNNDAANVAKFGYLYNWETAKSIAPKGWHLPTKAEWKTLYEFLGDDHEVVFNALIQDGGSGFNTLFGGFRGTSGEYRALGSEANFWSTTENIEGGYWSFICDTEFGNANMSGSDIGCGFSVRLFKD